MVNAPIFFIAQQVLLQKQLGFTLDTLLLFDKKHKQIAYNVNKTIIALLNMITFTKD